MCKEGALAEQSIRAVGTEEIHQPRVQCPTEFQFWFRLSVRNVHVVNFRAGCHVFDPNSMLSARNANTSYLIPMSTLQECKWYPHCKNKEIIVQRLDVEMTSCHTARKGAVGCHE